MPPTLYRTPADLPDSAPEWLRKARWENATIDLSGPAPVWHDGVWHGGVWRGGEWRDGTWHGGVWRGVWHGGVWRDGVWHGGVWHGGVWHDGVWHGGVWRGGEWRDGTWHGGVWHGGEWYGTTPALVPVVPDLASRLAAAVGERGEHLDMKTWHGACGTTHCRAGWIVTIAGEAGRTLEAKIGTAGAALMIHRASCPGEPDPDWYASDEDALADIRACANRIPQPAPSAKE